MTQSNRKKANSKKATRQAEKRGRLVQTDGRPKLDFALVLLGLIPILGGLAVWLSSLAFAPVPWPDDSAFYFVARELFRWPPRWVMLPQAPFEPTYRIFNFNTMPLYPVLIGLGRLVGIDGIFLCKIWPLGAWALSGSMLVTVLFRKGLPFIFCTVIALLFSLDPELRWASVLMRPESLIGLFGMAIVLGLTFGFPEKYKPSRFWDPISALLALGAYSHFNAIHLIFPVIFTFILFPKRLFQIGYKTALYLSPWLIAVLYHWRIFLQQMQVQWVRLSAPNQWLVSVDRAIASLFQELGNPTPWPPVLRLASMGMWILIFIALLCGIILPGLEEKALNAAEKENTQPPLSLLPAVGWLVGAIWIWHSKPEVWFMYYPHVALWCFSGVGLLKLYQVVQTTRFQKAIQVSLLAIPSTLLASMVWIFGYVDLRQAKELEETNSWHWSTYYDFVDCIDQQLIHLESVIKTDAQAKNQAEKPFRVWDPTFPDITVELSRKHPNWEFTRTNDFSDRTELALRHGWETDAVVVTETLGWAERTVSEKPEKAPGIESLWMLWQPYFLNRLWIAPGWKPNRFICQRGRWQAFLFMVKEPVITQNIQKQ